jgi:hypothetical protein
MLLAAAAAEAANSLPDPGHWSVLGWIIGALAALAVAANQIDEFLTRRKDKPAPGEVRHEAHGTFATKADLAALSSQLSSDRIASDVSRRRLHERLEKMRGELDSKIDGMPDRIIAMLTNLNVLRRPSDH